MKKHLKTAMEVAIADMRKEFGQKGKRVVHKVKKETFKFADYV